jgi:serine/threonine protein kinase
MKPAAGAWAPPADYEVLGELGHGELGVVYAARQRTTQRLVALKLSGPANPSAQHAPLPIALRHANVVELIDRGECRAGEFVAQELIDGASLDLVLAAWRRPGADSALRSTGMAALVAELVPSAIQDARRLTPHAAVKPGFAGSAAANVAAIGAQIAAALHCAHGSRIAHRDIKPANILVDASGHAWLTDFDLAQRLGRTTPRAGSPAGTARYPSPEQTQGRGVIDPRSDVFSLGVVLYELLTLRHPFADVDAAKTLANIAAADPIWPPHLDATLPDQLAACICKAMAKRPEHRQSAAALTTELRAALRSALTTRPTTPPPKPTPEQRSAGRAASRPPLPRNRRYRGG